MPTPMYSQAEIDAMFSQVVEEGRALNDRIKALEEGNTVPPVEPPPTGDIDVDVYAWWPNANSLAEWASIGVNKFVIPKKLGRNDTPSVSQAKAYTIITPYDPSYSPGSTWIKANFIEPDEPDAAAGSRTGPVDPAKFAADAAAVKSADPSHPTFASMGRSWVDLNYNGRGSAHAGKEEPLEQYAAAVDEMTFFVYPMTVNSSNTNAAIYRKIDCPLDGIERMNRLADSAKTLGFCMEAGNIYNVRRPTYDEMLHEATHMVDRAASYGKTKFRIVFFNMKTVGGYDGNDGLHDPECRRAMQDIAAMYA